MRKPNWLTLPMASCLRLCLSAWPLLAEARWGKDSASVLAKFCLPSNVSQVCLAAVSRLRDLDWVVLSIGTVECTFSDDRWIFVPLCMANRLTGGVSCSVEDVRPLSAMRTNHTELTWSDSIAIFVTKWIYSDRLQADIHCVSKKQSKLFLACDICH